MAKQISIAAMVVICISLMTLTPQPVWGQAVYGSIFGTVTDPQGAAVANAKVTVTISAKARPTRPPRTRTATIASPTYSGYLHRSSRRRRLQGVRAEEHQCLRRRRLAR